ncbi:MauE/DoxX family redox-associated membrane protein [Pedobacter jeongneungensis]|uniref:MauE/DoxX family redox-associated membrane protein n=1 Tax=Pedobacter jeongneungensis TaxID=947309 RepID=UPI003CD0611F
MENTYSNRGPHLIYEKLASYLNTAGVLLLIVLWSYAVFAKLADLELYKRQMVEQPFSPNIILVLTYLVPSLELLSATLLILNKHKLGLWISLVLLIGFTIYITLILSHVFPKVPCSCGGFISKMSWKNHLYFNMLLICFNIFCLYWFTKKERRLTGKE